MFDLQFSMFNFQRCLRVPMFLCGYVVKNHGDTECVEDHGDFAFRFRWQRGRLLPKKLIT